MSLFPVAAVWHLLAHDSGPPWPQKGFVPGGLLSFKERGTQDRRTEGNPGTSKIINNVNSKSKSELNDLGAREKTTWREES